LNDKTDKAVWLKWMERRVHNEVEAIRTPTGFIPIYDDLKELFAAVLNKSYAETAYRQQFTVRVAENLAKIERVKQFYQTTVPDTPPTLYTVLEEQSERLKEARERYGAYISPFAFD
jgi:phosphoenolpyruvate carboxykinase (GTP)